MPITIHCAPLSNPAQIRLPMQARIGECCPIPGMGVAPNARALRQLKRLGGRIPLEIVMIEALHQMIRWCFVIDIPESRQDAVGAGEEKAPLQTDDLLPRLHDCQAGSTCAQHRDPGAPRRLYPKQVVHGQIAYPFPWAQHNSGSQRILRIEFGVTCHMYDFLPARVLEDALFLGILPNQ